MMPSSCNRVLPSVLVSIAALLSSAAPSIAQQVTGVLGSASATTTITGKQLPPPDPKFGGVINDNVRALDGVVAAARRAAERCAQRAADHDR